MYRQQIVFTFIKKEIKKIILRILVIVTLGFLGYWTIEMFPFADGIKKDISKTENSKPEQKILNGDIIFQTSKSSQSKAIQLATNSKYSHMGIIYENNGRYFVYEAVQPVKLTPLKEWIDRGEDEHYVVKRIKNAENI